MATTVRNIYDRAEAVRLHPAKWKTAVVAALVALGSLLALLSLMAVWLNRQVVDTETYVDTVAPLSQDPAIQNATATAVTDQLFTEISVQQRAREVLPEQAGFLAAPITEALRGFVQGQAERLFASSQFSQLWQSANRRAHQALLAVVLGENAGPLSFSEGKVTLELGGFTTALRSRLEGLGLDIFANPDPATTGADQGGITIFESEGLTRIQNGVALLNRLATWLPLLSLVFLLAALTLTRNRYRTAIGIGLGLAAAAVALKLLMGIGRSYYLGALSGSGGGDQLAAQRFFDIIFASLARAGQYLFVLSLLLIGAALLAGPAAPMVRLRQAVKKRVQGAGGELKTPAGPWLGAHKNSLRLGAAVTVLLLLILPDQPSLFFLAGLVLLLLIFLAALELLAQQPITVSEAREETTKWDQAA